MFWKASAAAFLTEFTYCMYVGTAASLATPKKVFKATEQEFQTVWPL